MSNPFYFGMPLAELFFKAWCSGKIDSQERSNLRDALLYGTLSQDDLRAIDRLIHAVRRGWLEMEPSRTSQG